MPFFMLFDTSAESWSQLKKIRNWLLRLQIALVVIGQSNGLNHIKIHFKLGQVFENEFFSCAGASLIIKVNFSKYSFRSTSAQLTI